jgi:hypothetical protein
MKGRFGSAFVALVLATIIGLTGVADARKPPPKSWARNGCHLLALAYSSSVPESRRAIYVGDAATQFKHARVAYRPPHTEDGFLAWVVRAGELCKADFPTDRIIQAAHYPDDVTRV